MPNRLIRESIIASETLDRLSDGAERLFWRIVVKADDFGRFHAKPSVILGTCMPLRIGRVKLPTVEGWLVELIRVGLMDLYRVGDHVYGQLVTFEKHQGKPRANESKYPDPAQNIVKITSASICEQVPANVPVFVFVFGTSYSNTLTLTSAPPTQGSPVRTGGFDRFWTAYPRKKSKGQAEKAWAALSPSEPFQGQILAALERAKTSDEWVKDGGRYIPYPATWLRAKGWEDVAEVDIGDATDAWVAAKRREGIG